MLEGNWPYTHIIYFVGIDCNLSGLVPSQPPKSKQKHYLSCVEDRENVGECYMERGQKTKQPGQPQQWNQYHTSFDTKSAHKEDVF